MAENIFDGKGAFEPVPAGKPVPLYDAGTTVGEELAPIRAEAARRDAEQLRQLATQLGTEEISEPAVKTQPMQGFPVPPTVDMLPPGTLPLHAYKPVAPTVDEMPAIPPAEVVSKYRPNEGRVAPQDAKPANPEDFEAGPNARRGSELGRAESGETRPRRDAIFINSDVPSEERLRPRHDVIYLEPEQPQETTQASETKAAETDVAIRPRHHMMFTSAAEIAAMLEAAGVEGGEAHAGDPVKKGESKISPMAIRSITKAPDTPSL